MAGNFGIGLGSFLSGAVQGAQAYTGIQESRSRQKMNDLKLQDAENSYAEKIAKQDTQADVNRLGSVALSAAQQEHGDDVKKVYDKYVSTAIPQQQQRYLESGDVEAAEMLGNFMETKQAKQLTMSSAKAIKFGYMGDFDNAGRSMVDSLNISSEVSGGKSGYKYKSYKDLTNDKGVKTGGVSYVFTDPDGKDQTMEFKDQNGLISFISNTGMPDKIVSGAYDEYKTAKALRADNAKKDRDWREKVAGKGLDFGYKIAGDENAAGLQLKRDKIAAGYRISEQTNKAQLDGVYGNNGSGGTGATGKKVAEAEAAANYLRANGYTDRQIQESLPALLGIQNQGKNPTARIEETIKMLAASDPRFGRLSAQDKVLKARELIASIDGVAPAGGETTDNPFGDKGSEDASYYIDKKSGQVVYR